jgi:hypothetical protein
MANFPQGLRVPLDGFFGDIGRSHVARLRLPSTELIVWIFLDLYGTGTIFKLKPEAAVGALLICTLSMGDDGCISAKICRLREQGRPRRHTIPHG